MIRTFAQQSRAHRFPDQIKIQKAMTFYYLSTDSAKTQVIVICSQKKKHAFRWDKHSFRANSSVDRIFQEKYMGIQDSERLQMP